MRFGSVKQVASVIVAGAMCGPLQAQAGHDLAELRTRWEKWTVAGDEATLLSRGRTLAAQEGADGCWAAITYDDPAVSAWKAAGHLENMNDVAIASFVLHRQGKADASMDDAAVRALRCWLRRDLKNKNWWWNEIGAPKAVGQAALLMRGQLTKADLDGVDRVLRRSDWSKWTGQNLAWGVNIQMVRGMLEDDDAAVQQAFDRLYAEIRVAPVMETNGKPGEGIEADSSFHQHGAQLYSGGYGNAFASDVGRDVVLGWGTPFQIPAEPMRIYSAFILDGQRWMIRASLFDFTTVGREVTRAARSQKGELRGELARVATALGELDSPRQKEFRAFGESLKNANGAGEVQGNRFFWNSDLMEQKRAGYAASVRMFSTRTKNEEVVNGEGLRSVHLADGANLLTKSGDEYRGIFPVWNWCLIPGTTALQWASPQGVPLTGEDKAIGQQGRTDFVGGVSDGEYGGAAMMLDRGPLTAKKAWFFLDDLYVALGADIVSSSPERVATSVEQSNKNGAVTRETVDGKSVVLHNGTGYVLEAGERVMLSTGVQTGRWSSIGTGSDVEVTMPVFNLAIDHGVRPQGAGYRYTVMPHATTDEVRMEAEAPTVRVLANRGDMQAVYSADRGVLMAVFYRPGAIETPFGKIAVDQPCMLMVRRAGDVWLTASNPRAAAMELHVSMDGKRLEIALPGGELGGKSVTVKAGE